MRIAACGTFAHICAEDSACAGVPDRQYRESAHDNNSALLLKETLMSFVRTLALPAIAIAAGLGGCSAGPAIRADGDPSANLNSYKRFRFYDHVSTDKAVFPTI